MTDEAKALVQRLEEWALTLLAACEGGDLGTDEPAALMYQAADLIETQAREIERLREALALKDQYFKGITKLAALGETSAALAGDSHDQ